MSDQDVTGIEERLDILAGRRQFDRLMQWVTGVAGVLVTTAIIGLIVTVIDLRSTTAVSNTELRGAIDRLSERLEAGAVLGNTNLAGVLERVTRNERRIEAIDERLRAVELQGDRRGGR